MEQKNTDLPANTLPHYQKKYRKKQTNRGLVRFELQVNETSKARFEQLVEEAAEEYVEPFSKRQRMAKARARIFDEITRGVIHEFFTLKDRMKALKDEVAALSPSFFQTNAHDKTPLPTAIEALPNDPTHLKALLANFYRQLQSLAQTGKEHERRAKQYLSLYETSLMEADRLKIILERQGLLPKEEPLSEEQ